ncbi:hypothetical protein CLV58_109128 [Spirosoma oryzae]|uniref:Uncharacterized protein n=1 Tax=Spirosoma oryzae TaxID=1469603 RepID=A0A2T0SY96_9BACT|nr:hypothetical protein [Spirosoma oryzae]PRY38401.1 hypothetical protein CLV58_109128 [Spirosoma oryzae]
MANPFKPGDKVICIDAKSPSNCSEPLTKLVEGKEYQVDQITNNGYSNKANDFITLIGDTDINTWNFRYTRFKLVKPMNKPFVSALIDDDQLPEAVKYKAGIFIPAEPGGNMIVQQYRSVETLLSEGLGSRWGGRNQKDTYRYKMSRAIFDTPEEAKAYGKAELQRVFGKPEPESTNVIEFVNL